MYQALYRKWRPRTFDEVAGQQHITETLKNQVKTGRLSHAYLFIGTRGTGKTSCAKILAKAVNCEAPMNGNPCNKCRSCLGIDSGAVMDVVELDAASNNSVDNVRALRDEAVFTPALVKKRVYIIDEVHMLSMSAFNALLKILEEPPQHLMFILATTELHKVPATILSRCQRHSFKRLDAGIIAKQLMYVAQQENMELEEDAAELLGRLAEGSMRDGLSLLDQCAGETTITAETVLSAMGLAGNFRILRMMELITERDTAQVLTMFQEMWRDGKDPATLLNELGTLHRDIIMSMVAPRSAGRLLSGGYDLKALKSFAGKLTAAEYMSNLRSIQDALGLMRNSQSPKTIAELCLIGLCEPDLGDSLPALRARVSRLEALIETGARVMSEASGPSPETTAEPLPAPHEEHVVEEAPVEDDVPWSEATGEKAASPKTGPSETVLEEGTPALDYQHRAEVSENNPDNQAELWKRMLGLINNKIPIGTYNILSDEFHVSAEFSNGALVLKVKNGFAMGLINKPEITDRIREAAREVCKAAVPIRLEEEASQMGINMEKIEQLKRFGNVKFE
ncbi:MAG: DNA polymerase III subunit gamma/tau [Oscillospiraceae bacterium]|jgi:DNA polymerase-3 subunit gamma/tau